MHSARTIFFRILSSVYTEIFWLKAHKKSRHKSRTIDSLEAVECIDLCGFALVLILQKVF